MSIIDLEVSKAPIRSVKHNVLRSDSVFMVISYCDELAVFTVCMSNRPRRIYAHSARPDTLIEAFFVTQSELVIVMDKGRIALINYFDGEILDVCSLSVGVICCAVLYEQYLLLGVKTGGVVVVDWTQLPTHKWLPAAPSRPLLSMLCTEVKANHQNCAKPEYLCLVIFLSTSFTISVQVYTLAFDEYPNTHLQKLPIATSPTSCILHLLWLSQDLVLAALRVHKARKHFHCSIESLDLLSHLEKTILLRCVRSSKHSVSFCLRDVHPSMNAVLHRLQTESLDNWIVSCPVVASPEGPLIIFNDTSFHASLKPARKPFIASYHRSTVTSVCYYNQSFVSGDEAGHVYYYNKNAIRAKNDQEEA